MPTPGPRRALQPVDAGSVILGPVDVLLAARLAWLGLAALERRDGGVPDAFRTLTRDLCDAAEQSRRRIEQEARRPHPGSGTSRARTGPAVEPCGQWLTTSQVAGMLGCDESYARRLARKGRLEARRTGRGAWEFEPNQIAATAGERAGPQRLDLAV